jgi:hypothetical protein
MRIPVSSIVESQLPTFVREEYPLFVEFFKQYYLSDTSESIIQNLDKNIDLDFVFGIRSEAILNGNIGFNNSVIVVDSTIGFPDNNGLIKIDDEIILYESKTETEFVGCKRGFSGVTSIDRKFLEFSESESARHSINSKVFNLSVIYIQQFAIQIKKKITPGFENREFFEGLNTSNFAKNAKSFYSSKGSDESFKILFGALYGKPVDIIKPRDFLIRPSDAQYRITKDLVTELITGDPYKLINSTIYQDGTEFIEPAQGTVIEITKIIRNNKDFYIISLDYDYNRDVDVSGTVKSEFSIHPKTISTSKMLPNSNYIDVDSTVGFPDSGELKINLDDGSIIKVKYGDKVLNQFLDCSGIVKEIPEKTEIKIDNLIYGFDVDGNRVELFVNGVLGDIDYIDETFSYETGEKIKIKTLGDDIEGVRANNWYFNVPVTYDVEKIELDDSSDFSYRAILFDEHNFVIGDSFTLYSSDGINYTGIVNFVENEKNIIISGQGVLNTEFKYTIRKNISKVNISDQKYSEISIFNSNIQNIYTDYEKNVYVSSPSLPTYLGFPLRINDFTLNIPRGDYNGTDTIAFTNSHGVFTGEPFVLKSNNSKTIAKPGTYFIFSKSPTEIKLAESLENIANNIFITFNENLENDGDNKLEPLRFNDLSFNKLPLRPQNIIKKLETPKPKITNEETPSGTIGIFVNGVEISNYKSDESVFYGPIDSVDILNGGSGYNIINPPTINVIDNVGYGASITPGILGQLERIDILDPGFDYIDEPKISITGGGGIGAEAVAKLREFIHFSEFNSETSIDVLNNIIEFEEDHKFSDNEEVIYRTNSQANVVGLDTGSVYYVKPLDAKRVKLHYTLEQSSNSTNAVNLTGLGVGIHSLVSKNVKKRVSNIIVTNPGAGYKNRRVVISGINTASNNLIIKGHNYNSGEVVRYYFNGSPIAGLTTHTDYIVTNVDQDQVRLSTSEANYKKNIYLDLTTFPSGIHYLNYPEISVEITGRIGLTPFAGQDFNAKLQPVFSGQIYSIFLDNGGQNYGSADIINYHKKPKISIDIGKNAQLTPVIQNGTIIRVIVNSTGNGYNQIPELVVGPTNNSVVLTPVIENGKLVEVIVVDGGQGLDPNTTVIAVISKGSGSNLSANIRSRSVNLVQKLISSQNITEDDGFIIKNIDTLQYTHLYSPRSLRRTLLRKVGNVNVRDLNTFQSKEILSTNHSPLIGWAYDGNPIYGPYGYSNGSSGQVKLLTPGYKLKSNSQLEAENRPAISIFPKGFFVEDYYFEGNGDLDENNGRYCITPEFPQGTYAYFCTISGNVASFGQFVNYFYPIFPYIIGPTYKNKKIEISDNFKELGDKLLRNTTPYKLLSNNSRYEFITNPNKIKEESFDITKTGESIVDGFDIIDPGTNYKIGDTINLSDGTISKVSELKGRTVISAGVSHTSFSDMEIVPYRNSYIGTLKDPHNLNSSKIFRLNSEFELNKQITATPYFNNLTLASNVNPGSITGIITYFNVRGNLDFPLKENDIFSIDDEKLRVLSIDKTGSRIKVQRAYNGSPIGVSTYTSNTLLVDDSRKLIFNTGISTNYNFKTNKEYFFNPVEAIGIGTVGFSTVVFSNPGSGVTFLTIPNKTIFLKGHELNSGDALFYSNNGGNSIEISFSGIGTTSLQNNQELFVKKVSNDLISISTDRSLNTELSFVSIGSSDNHSFKTNYSGIFLGNISNNTVTVITESQHNLGINDIVDVDVSNGISTTYSLYYNQYNRRLCVNKRNIDDIDVINNTFTSINHRFSLGEMVIYVENSTISGLVNQKIYYIVPITKDKFKLTAEYYDSLISPLNEINITSSGTGYFYSVNPKIDIVENQEIVFDVSDPSLSYSIAGERFAGFDLGIFNDITLKDTYSTFELSKDGIVGISSNAKYTLNTKNIPSGLFYGLKPTLNAPEIFQEIFPDTDQVNSYVLRKIKSGYSGKQQIVSVGSTIFTYDIFQYPEINSYNNFVTYTTNSKNSDGPISNIKITNTAYSKIIPNVIGLSTENGQGAKIVPVSNKIGKIEGVKKLDIGFDYTVDYTIRPKANIPKILKIEPLFKLDSIDVLSRGYGYTFAPDLLIINNDNRLPYDVELQYNIDDNKVKILQNSNQLQNENLKVVPINNDNGFDISEITFNETTKIVTVRLGTPFNDIQEFPFGVGEEVYIENVPSTGGSGYNSSDYGYASFEIISSTPNIGGIGATFIYKLDVDSPGTIDNFYTSGTAIPVKYLPVFKINTTNNQYLTGEDFETLAGKSGKIVKWDPINSSLKVDTVDNVEVGDTIFGETSKNYSNILEVYSPEAYVDIQSSSIVNKGWNTNIGFLNDPMQRLHDSDYYQYFSYDLRSEEPYSNWSDPVDALNHPAGFKKFGNLLINTTHNNIGFNTTQDLGDVDVINDLQSVIDVNCYYDFDLVTENYFNINDTLSSNEIYFNSRRIQNYIESIGNKVVLMDDISGNFLPVLRGNNTSVERFNKLIYRFKKYLIHVFNRIEPQDSQTLLINLLHNDNQVAISQYALNDSGTELGTFNATINNINLSLNFFPFDLSNKLYSVNSFSYNISDSEDDTSSLSLGDIVEIRSHKVLGSGEIISPSNNKEPSTIVSIPETKTAAKVLVVYSDKENNLYYSDEINYIHDGSNIISNSYGEINLGNPSGIGTYNFYYDNSNVNIDFYPNDEVDYEVNCLSVEFSNTVPSTTSTVVVSGNVLESSLVGIATTTKTLIYSYSDEYKSGLHQILVEDVNTGDIQYSEFLTMLNSINQEVYIVEFGNLSLGITMGTVSAEYSNITGDLEIYFTAVNGVNCEIRSLNNLISRFRRSETLEV